MQLTEQMFLDEGYRRYEHTPLIDKSSSHLLCKSFWVGGVRAYVIVVYVYPAVRFYDGTYSNLTFEPHVQLSKEDDSTYNLSLLLSNTETIQSMEQKFHHLFLAVGPGYA